MLKKVLSLLLTMVVITGIFGTAAFAAVPQMETDLDTDGETVKGHYYVDNFDVDEDITMKSDYPGNGTNAENTTVSKTSNVFSNASSTAATIVIDADAGKDGEGALIYKNKENSTAKLTVKSDYISDLAVGDCAVFSYDLKFATLADVIDAGYTKTIQLGATNGNSGGYHIGVTKQSSQSAYFYKYIPSAGSGSTTTVAIDTTKWYTMVHELIPTTLVRDEDGKISSLSAKRKTSIIDEDGNAVVSHEITITGTNYLYFYGPVLNSGAYGSELHIDNASLSVYDMTKYAPSLTNTPSIANKTVGIGQQTTRVSFDQPIKEAAAVVKNLTDTTAADITCTVTAATDALWSYDITIPSGTLAIETDYKIDLSGFKNNGGTACADSVNFETQKATAVDYSKSADFSISYATASTNSDITWTTSSGGTEKRRGFPNYPLLYFGAEYAYTSAENGVAEIKDGAGWSYLGGGIRIRTTETLTISEGITHVLTYRLKIGEKSGITPLLQMGFLDHVDGAHPGTMGMSGGSIANFTTKTNAESGETELVISNPINSDTAPWQTNTWYDIIYTVDYDGHEIKIYNSETNQFVYSVRETFGVDCTAPTSYGFMLAEMAGSNFVPISLDDVTQWKLDSTKEWSQPSSVTNDISSGLSPENASITLTYDQPMITEPGEYKVLDADGRFAGEVSITQSDFCSQKLNITGLDYGESYKLDYSDAKNLVGQGLHVVCEPTEVEFTTVNDDKNEFAVQGETVVSGLGSDDTVTFDLYSRDGGNLELICALYDPQGKLLGVETQAASTLAAKSTTEQSITLSKDYSAARKMKIFGWDELSGLKALMETEKLTAPRREVSMLMIGNSLTEDALRNLANVASSGDLTVNVTAKLCGGASLTDHAGNLVAEIENGRTADQAQEEINNNSTGSTLRYLYFNKGNNAMSDKLISTALVGETKYDIVSIQPYGKAESEIEAMQTIVDYVKKYQPQAEIVLYQPWSDYSKYQVTRNSNFEAIESHTQELIEAVGEMTVVPSGYAFYLACNQDGETYGAQYYEAADSNTDAGEQATDAEKTEFLNSTGLWRDISHGSYYGCYLTDAVWYEVLTGRRAPTTFTNTDTQMTAPTADAESVQAEKLEFLSQMAHRAVAAYK